MKKLQFIETTPEQLETQIIDGVKEHLDNFKKHFEPKTPTEFLTRQETANLLKVDLSTIHNYTKQKKLKAYGIGHRVYYKRSEIEESLIRIN